MKIRHRSQSLAILVSLTVIARAPAQPAPLPPGLNMATTQPVSPEALKEITMLAKRYEEALAREIKFANEGQLEGIRATLATLIDNNARFEAGTRAARENFAAEIRSLENSDEAKTPQGRSRMNYLYGQFEQILLNSSLEPEIVYLKIVLNVPEAEREKARKALEKARGRFVELPGPVDLKSIAPGALTGRAAFALARYRSERKIGAPTSAVDVPVVVQSTDVIQLSLPRYFAPAPPLEEWGKYFETAAKRFGYSSTQKASAEVVLNELRKRASDDRDSRREFYDAVARFKDAEQRQAQLRELNRPIDELFDELKHRLVNLATIEQYHKAFQEK